MNKNFPIDALPAPYRNIVIESASAIGCDHSMVALPVITSAAAAIGNSRVIEGKRGWLEPSVIWSGIVAPSGSAKSPALKEGVRPLLEHEKYSLKNGTQSTKKSSSSCITPRHVISDTTIAATAECLSQDPRGLFLVRDELAGWVEGVDKRIGGSQWLSLFNADSLIVDRAKKEPISISRAAVSICGGFQPGILRRQLLAAKHRESGMAARFLFAFPEPRPIKWSDESIRVETRAKYEAAILRLLELQPMFLTAGSFEPEVLRLSPKSRALFKEYFNRNAAMQFQCDENLAAALSKLKSYACRLAMVLELARWSGTDCSEVPTVSLEESMSSAIELVEWFTGEAKKVYSLVNKEAKAPIEKVIQLISRRGGTVTARELCQYHRAIKNTAEADVCLQELVELGWGKWTQRLTSEKGGRPTRIFTLDVCETPVGLEDFKV